MKDFRNDPPKEDLVTMCCGFEMKEIAPHAVMCLVCGSSIYVQPEIDSPLDEGFDFDELMELSQRSEIATICHHGRKPEDCDACYTESDIAYDIARERKYKS